MNRELLMLVEAISREKNVERDVVLGAVEAALAQATKKLVSRRSGYPRVHGPRQRQLRNLPPLAGGADDAGLQNPEAEELLMDAPSAWPASRLVKYIEEAVESLPIGRIGAMAAKQVHLAKNPRC